MMMDLLMMMVVVDIDVHIHHGEDGDDDVLVSERDRLVTRSIIIVERSSYFL
jgi:hypothetical protein